MHEMALCEGIVEIVEQEARKGAFAKVKTVWLEIGALSHVAPVALRFCFEAVTAKTLLQGATLEIIEQPGAAWCLGCSRSVEISQRYQPCPACGSHQLQVTGGEDMRVKELEVE
ncbi:hydrogenase expression/formation protein HypA [Bradyrhizobium oligotrophicum S58]|uniref:Hydrogenase maturation factor HypA n=1 Tax=Bradyrhizobium oligotrophicum S58 TaxID=1245469 RepID=M4ZDD9_9BRAD|nr:hydrogenase maturation nickel metallochaperone HypA [Bradyrhizobium oligotrophicum]BAM91822.1 hydrogenase expression/formation protein HypA [Bradyrhizobium oligotrophicum S58]